MKWSRSFLRFGLSCLLLLALNACGEDNEPFSILDESSAIVAQDEADASWIATSTRSAVLAQSEDSTQIIALNSPLFSFGTLTTDGKTNISFSLQDQNASIPPTAYPLAPAANQPATVFWEPELLFTNDAYVIFYTEPSSDFSLPTPGRILAYASETLDPDIASTPTVTNAPGIYSMTSYNDDSNELIVNARGLGDAAPAATPNLFWWRPSDDGGSDEIKPIVNNIGPFGAKVRSLDGKIYAATTEATGPRILKFDKAAIESAIDSGAVIDGIDDGEVVLTLTNTENKNVLLTDFDIVGDHLLWIETTYDGAFATKLTNSLHHLDMSDPDADLTATELFSTRDLAATQMIQIKRQSDNTMMLAIQSIDGDAPTTTESFLLTQTK